MMLRTKHRKDFLTMTTELQSNILSAGTVKKVMPACMVYALVQSLTFMVDTVIAGHFMGADAVAAVALGMPMIGLMLSFTSMILQGGFLKMLNCMGKSDMEWYRRIYSLSLTLTVIVDVIFIAVCLFLTDGLINICGGSKATPEAVEYARLYIRADCPVVLFFCMGSLFQLVVATFGYQTERMICSVVNVGVNIGVSIAAVMLLPEEYKIAGLGIGSAAGAFLQMIIAYVMIKYRNITVKYRLYAPNKKNVMDSLDCIRRGLPSSIDSMLDSVCSSVVNNVILGVFADGTGVLALVSMIKTIGSVVRTVGRGTLYASEPLFGILFGGRDKEGIKKTFTASLRLGLIYAAALAVILIALQSPILSFYHLGDSADARTGLILIALSGIISVFPFTFSSVYESTDHLSLSLLAAALPDSVLYPVLVAVFGRIFGVTGIWLAYGYNFVIFFAVYYLILIIIHKRFPVPLDKLLALGKIKERFTVLDVSIPTETESVTFVAETLQRFFNENGTSKKNAYISALCMEEIAADYLSHRKASAGSGKKSYMDIKAFCDDGRIELILRNYDKPYDPLVFEREDETFAKIGVTMVQKVAEDITYSYSYHLNIVSVTIA